jgi:hypothetical protein
MFTTAPSIEPKAGLVLCSTAPSSSPSLSQLIWPAARGADSTYTQIREHSLYIKMGELIKSRPFIFPVVVDPVLSCIQSNFVFPLQTWFFMTSEQDAFFGGFF